MNTPFKPTPYPGPNSFIFDIPALNSCDLPVENCELDLPPLQEVADVLAAGLKKNFAEVDVQVRNFYICNVFYRHGGVSEHVYWNVELRPWIGYFMTWLHTMKCSPLSLIALLTSSMDLFTSM